MSDLNLFENFPELRSNRFARQAARTVAAMPGEAFNPLWIYGPSGTGKTFLLDTVDTAMRMEHPRRTTLRCQTEQFARELVDALSTGSFSRFRSHCVHADAILLDHADCLYGKPVTQQEIGLLLAEAVRQGHQVVLVSDCPPNDLDRLREIFVQQCEFFLQADIHHPDSRDRISFARSLARQSDLELSDAAFSCIAASTRTLFQVRSAVTHIAARRQLLDLNEAELMKALEQFLPRQVSA